MLLSKRLKLYSFRSVKTSNHSKIESHVRPSNPSNDAAKFFVEVLKVARNKIKQLYYQMRDYRIVWHLETDNKIVKLNFQTDTITN
jgi:hypothetical protein